MSNSILNKKTITYIFIIFFIIMTLVHLYKINNTNDTFKVLTEEQNVGSNDVFIDTMDQIIFNTVNKNLKTLMDEKMNESQTMTLVNNAMPELSVISYAGSTAPTGWQLCNGTALKYTNGYFVSNTDERTSSFNKNPTGDLILTPDLKGKFILGDGGAGDNKALHNDGGEETHTLTIEEMPEHNHTHKDRIHVEPHAEGNSFDPPFTRLGFEHLDYTAYTKGDANADWQHWGNQGRRKIWGKNDITGNVGGNAPHNNMPPYYVLTYIIKQPAPLSS
jgi:microcystin-dependent protein